MASAPLDGPLDLGRPRRTSPLSALFGLVRQDLLRALAPALLIAASIGRLAVVLAGAATIAAVAGVASWWRRLWSFDGDVLHLDEGVLVRNQRRIPVTRLQHVELERRLRHQLFGLAAVRVETAGGAGTELRLDAIPLAEAQALQTAVQARAGSDDVAGEPGDDGPDPGGIERDDLGRPLPPQARPTPTTADDPAEVLVRLPPGRLLIAGITGPEIVAVLAALAFAIDALMDLGVDPDQIESVEVATTTALVLALVAVPVWFLTAGLISVMRRWDLTVTVRGDELRVSYGLLRQQELVMSTRRLQDVRIHHRFLLRPFHRADVRLRSAASGSGDSSRIDIPLLDHAEIDQVLERVLPAAVPRPTLAPAPPGARRRSMGRGGLVGSALGVLAAVVLWSALGVAALAVVVVFAGAGLGTGELYWRGLGWAEAGGVHHSRTGAYGRQTSMAPVGRVQSSGVRASLFQRRRGLATAHLDLAGGRIAVVDRDAVQARAVAAAAALDG